MTTKFSKIFNSVLKEARKAMPVSVLLPHLGIRRSSKDRLRSTHLLNKIDVEEGIGTVRCKKCKETCHNMRQCPKDQV